MHIKFIQMLIVLIQTGSKLGKEYIKQYIVILVI